MPIDWQPATYRWACELCDAVVEGPGSRRLESHPPGWCLVKIHRKPESPGVELDVAEIVICSGCFPTASLEASEGALALSSEDLRWELDV